MAEAVKALNSKPANEANWSGPYLKKTVPNDPWGRPYVYRVPGTKASQYASLASLLFAKPDASIGASMTCSGRVFDRLWRPLLLAALNTEPEEASVELKTLHHKLGAGRFSFGSADLMLELLGVAPGAVTAFGLINDTSHRVNLVLDAGLMENAIINCHPLVNTMTTSIARDDLLRFFAATGHVARA